MHKLKILNKKEIKHIFDIISKQWGADIGLDYAFFMSEKEKLYIANKDISKIDETKLRIDTLGLYFGELRNNELRLTIEGSQIIGPKAKKNIFSLDDEQLKSWFSGEDIPAEHTDNCFLLLKHSTDFVGCGKFKEGKILNFVPKTRRTLSIH